MSNQPTTDEGFMKRCLALARQAASRGNTPVGSVVVLGGRVVGEGAEELPAGDDLTGHAEIIACQNAAQALGRRDLSGAVFYTTAEPCVMCSYIIRQARISRVVYGIETPTIGGATSSLPVLTSTDLGGW